MRPETSEPVTPLSRSRNGASISSGIRARLVLVGALLDERGKRLLAHLRAGISSCQAHQAASELYFVSREEPGEPNRLAANVGVKHNLRDNLQLHAAVGKSVREGNRGGPDL